MRFYDVPDFVVAIARRTRTPVMAIVADGMGASSLRYNDIDLPHEIRVELLHSDHAFPHLRRRSRGRARLRRRRGGLPPARARRRSRSR